MYFPGRAETQLATLAESRAKYTRASSTVLYQISASTISLIRVSLQLKSVRELSISEDTRRRNFRSYFRLILRFSTHVTSTLGHSNFPHCDNATEILMSGLSVVVENNVSPDPAVSAASDDVTNFQGLNRSREVFNCPMTPDTVILYGRQCVNNNSTCLCMQIMQSDFSNKYRLRNGALLNEARTQISQGFSVSRVHK